MEQTVEMSSELAVMIVKGMADLNERRELLAALEEGSRNLVKCSWEKREKGIMSALPECLRPYMDKLYDEDRPYEEPSGTYQIIIIRIPELAKIRMAMVYDRDLDGWIQCKIHTRTGFEDCNYDVAHPEEYEKVIYYLWKHSELTNDLKVALGMAAENGLEFARMVREADEKNQADAATEVKYGPMDENEIPENNFMNKLTELIRDVVRKEISN